MKISEDSHVSINRYFGHITNYYESGAKKKVLTRAEKMAIAQQAIKDIVPLISTSRMWFSVCKALMALQLVGNEDFKNAVNMIKSALPDELMEKVDCHDLQKLNAQSLVKDVVSWDPKDSPVGRYTPEFQTVYYVFMARFE